MTTPVVDPTAIANGCSLTVNWTQNGQPAATVLGGYVADTASAITQAEVQRWLNAFVQNVASYISNSVTCTGGIYRDLRAGADDVIEVGPPASAAGGFITGTSFAAASFLVKWRTADASRSGKGRTFLPGVANSHVNADGRTLTAAAINDLTVGLNAYRAAMEPADGIIVPGVLSRKKGFSRQVTGYSIGQVVGIQRRRMRA